MTPAREMVTDDEGMCAYRCSAVPREKCRKGERSPSRLVFASQLCQRDRETPAAP